jgi:hypothetical protein
MRFISLAFLLIGCAHYKNAEAQKSRIYPDPTFNNLLINIDNTNN